jgi:hypothetical protein
VKSSTSAVAIVFLTTRLLKRKGAVDTHRGRKNFVQQI